MSEVFVVVEGPTEQQFISNVLAPWLGNHGVYISASRVGKPGHKGGNRYAISKRDLLNFLKQRSDTIVTSMFDFYGMKSDWPGRIEADSKNHEMKPVTVEQAIFKDIAEEYTGLEDRFYPYVQMHEFEALLFSYPPSLSMALGEEDVAEKFQHIRNRFRTPEHINDSPETAPSKCIGLIFRDYKRRYQKVMHGSMAAKKVTVKRMLEECPHFKTWVKSLMENKD